MSSSRKQPSVTRTHHQPRSRPSSRAPSGVNPRPNVTSSDTPYDVSESVRWAEE